MLVTNGVAVAAPLQVDAHGFEKISLIIGRSNNAPIRRDTRDRPTQSIILRAAREYVGRKGRGRGPVRQSLVIGDKLPAPTTQIALEVEALILIGGGVVAHVGDDSGAIAGLEHASTQIESESLIVRLTFSVCNLLEEHLGGERPQIGICGIRSLYIQRHRASPRIILTPEVVAASVPGADRFTGCVVQPPELARFPPARQTIAPA